MCTSLVYRDKDGGCYVGRTLELDFEYPYAVVYVPSGVVLSSKVEGHEPLNFTVKHPFLAVVSPDRMPTAEQPLQVEDFMVVEGLNQAGVNFSLLAYPSTGGPERPHEKTQQMLEAFDLGKWILSTCGSVEETKQRLQEQPVHLTKIAALNDTPYPFHLVVNDKSGGSVVLEFQDGELIVHDNPVGVMTNGPDFQWHLTNLRNWTHLTNVDYSTNTFGSLSVNQPDSGIATAALPGSNTSVGRFIRAVYYSKFAEPVAPEKALLTVSRIMNNFDRPRGITIDPKGGGEGVSLNSVMGNSSQTVPTEYTSWTSLSDMNQGKFMIRTYDAFGYSLFDLGELAKGGKVRYLLTTHLDAFGGDVTASMSLHN